MVIVEGRDDISWVGVIHYTDNNRARLSGRRLADPDVCSSMLVLVYSAATLAPRHWPSIQRKVGEMPSASLIRGSQPSTCLRRELSLLRPRTPCGRERL